MSGRNPGGQAVPAGARDAAGPEGGVGEDVFVTLRLAAELSGLDGADLRRLIEAGTIKAMAAGELTLIPMASLRRYLDGRRSGEGRPDGQRPRGRVES